ncbi:MAG TPA: DUF559 domain-containing protein, partial [Xanthobacteraceae bacterium]
MVRPANLSSRSRACGRVSGKAVLQASVLMDDGSKHPNWPVRTKQRACARLPRRDLSVAGRIIWRGPRAYRLEGLSLRGQTPTGRGIVDFVAHAKKLSIEIDGEQHFAPGQMQRDERREPLLAANPFRVLRFNNNDVIADRTGALEAILSALARG